MRLGSGQAWCEALVYENELTTLTQPQIALTSGTNTTPVVMQSTAAHNLQNGDVVSIQGVTPSTIDSTTTTSGVGPTYSGYPVHVIDSTHFALVGSTGTSTYSGGTATLVSR